MENENEFVMDRKVKVTEVGIRADNEEVQQVRIKTDIGHITWKPKVLNETFEKGIVVSSMVRMKKDQLPQKILDIAQKVQEKGSCDVKVSYATFTKEVDGEEVTYRFIRSEKTLDHWEIV